MEKGTKRILAAMWALLGMVSVVWAQPVLSERQFTEEFARALRKASPGIRVEIIEPLVLKVTAPDREESTAFLDNAYTSYKQAPAEKKDVIARYVASSLETLSARDAAVDESRIVPVVKDRGWLEDTRQAMKERGAKEIPEYVHEDLNRELIVLYAQDSSNSIRYLMPADIEKLSVGRKGLGKLARDNLKRILPKIESHAGEGTYMLTAGGDYEASLLLLDSIWTANNFQVKGDIVVTIPTRDLLLVTGSEDKPGLARIRAIAAKAFEEGPYRLTTVLFVYRQGKFVEFR